MDQDLTQLGVAALGDTKQLRLATGRVLPWHEPEPRCEVSPLAERGAVPNGGNQSGRNNGPDAWDLPSATATCVARSNLLKPVGQFIDLLFDCLPLVPQNADHVAHHSCQRVLCVLQNISHRGLQLRRLLRKHHAAFKQKRPYLVDDRRAPGDQPITNPLHRLQVEQVIRLDRDKAHVLALGRFGNRFCIDEVVLVGLHKWLHELRRDKTHIMSLVA